ncbi:MAG: DUF4249 domain-containing protein [Cyclobacteriaceae bacterium]
MKNLLIYISIVTLLVSFSCETVVDIDVPIAPPSLVVNSRINTDSTNFNIDLTESDFILSEVPFRSVTGAEIVLTEDGEQKGIFRETADGIYQNDTQPLAGKTYGLTISKEGYETISAETVIPGEEVAIKSVTTGNVTRDGSDFTLIKVTVDDPGDVANFYEIGVFFYEKRYDNETGELLEGDSVAYFEYIELDGTDFEDDATSYGQTVLVSDLFFDGLTHDFDLLVYNLYNAGPGVPEEDRIQYYVTIRNTSEEYYNYIRTRKLQDYVEGDPFSEPVIVADNIVNGFGIFAGFSADSEKIVVE